MSEGIRTQPPSGASVSVTRHRVPFYETDAMRVVHHSNYVRYLELGRIEWMDEHDRPYREYVQDDLHFATTRVELDYERSAVYDDVVDVVTWLEWVRGASIRIAYQVRRGEELLATGATEHVMVNDAGRPRRIPAERRKTLASRVGRSET